MSCLSLCSMWNSSMVPESAEISVQPKTRPSSSIPTLKTRSTVFVTPTSMDPRVICAMDQCRLTTYWYKKPSSNSPMLPSPTATTLSTQCTPVLLGALRPIAKKAHASRWFPQSMKPKIAMILSRKRWVSESLFSISSSTTTANLTIRSMPATLRRRPTFVKRSIRRPRVEPSSGLSRETSMMLSQSHASTRTSGRSHVVM
mmetsp:Transcript_115974/g.328652  ORF Transcript_115974/g.328652 Transcript_115974/m.328652 type:complete len:201 (+) Transcript_115974:243-845(+)